MLRVAMIMNLVAYSVVASQPLAYMLVLSKARRALSAPAFIETRQCIDVVMNRRVPVIYLGALATLLIVLALSAHTRKWNMLATAGVAFVCLVTHLARTMLENVPINSAIHRWSTTNCAEDWEKDRAKSFRIFSYRQVVLFAGFLSLLVGPVFQLLQPTENRKSTLPVGRAEASSGRAYFGGGHELQRSETHREPRGC